MVQKEVRLGALFFILNLLLTLCTAIPKNIYFLFLRILLSQLF
jgi:starvation-inducible outer membrane lipoprotein